MTSLKRIFQGDFWGNIDTSIWKAGIGYFLLTLIWALVSFGLYFFEGPRSYFEIQAILQFKILLVAVIFLGRYCFFSQYRAKSCFIRVFLIAFLMIIGITGNSLFKSQLKWAYLLLKGLDAIIWGILLAAIGEALEVMYRCWFTIQKSAISKLPELWRKFWNETMALGILLTLMAGLAYYYLMSFYLIDALIYSYVLVGVMVISGLSLFLVVYQKFSSWVQEEIYLIEQELWTYQGLESLKEEPELFQKLLWFKYLFSLRDFVIKTNRLKISLKVLISYTICICFILYLPYLFGLVVEVGSFK